MTNGVVMVTGGSRGIGAEIAVQAAVAGNDVVIGYVDPNKQRRVDEVIQRVGYAGQECIGVRADITQPDEIDAFIAQSFDFAAKLGRPVAALVLNAAGGLEQGATAYSARQMNARSPWLLTQGVLRAAKRTVRAAGRTDVVYVTSNPSHFYGHPNNDMPSSGYDIVAASKNAGETTLRSRLGDTPDNRLLVATADLVDGTAGATLLRMAHRRSTGDKKADLFTERNRELQGLIGRGTTTAREFGASIVRMLRNDNLPSGYTLYMPTPVLAGRVVPPAELPFDIGQSPDMYSFQA